jgi:hypothetical protein
MGTYVLNINVDSTIFPTLVNGGYKLCIAQKVNDQYTVVWSGTTFVLHNTFQWQQSYQMFCSLQLQAGSVVSPGTVEQDIAFGQTCVLDKIGALGSATGTVEPSGMFYLNNEYGPIYPGVSNLLGKTFSPIFVNPYQVVKGTTRLSPVVKIMVWFDVRFTTGTMFHESISNSYEVNYREATTHSVAYTAQGTWSAQNIVGQVTAQPRRAYHREIGFTYEDSDVDPYAFINAARDSDLSGSGRIFLPVEWLAECKVSFPTRKAADDARAYLKQKIIYNIHQSVSEKTDEVTFHVKLRWGYVSFMTWMIAGSTDNEKIQNAFNAELRLLSVPPTSSQYIADRIPHSPLALLASGTHIALDRDVHSKTAVVGDRYHVGVLFSSI